MGVTFSPLEAHTGAVWEAVLVAAIAASALLVGALVDYVFHPPVRLVAVVMALGSGLLIGSVAYDLVENANLSLSTGALAASLLAGAMVFVLGSRVIERRGGRRRKQPVNGQTPQPSAGDQSLSIVLGSALDGIPESFVLGLSVLHGGVSWPLMAGIALSNLPEGMAATSGLRARGWSWRRTAALWGVVIAVSAAAAGLGHELLANDDGTITGVAQTFAAGALLAMVTDTMVPEAYEVDRWWTGALVVAGFAASLVLGAVL